MQITSYNNISLILQCKSLHYVHMLDRGFFLARRGSSLSRAPQVAATLEPNLADTRVAAESPCSHQEKRQRVPSSRYSPSPLLSPCPNLSSLIHGGWRRAEIYGF
jgi:hypothetical protein